MRPQSLVVQIGDTAQFHCAVSGHPTPTIRWLLDGVPLSNSITYSINSAGTLTIRDVSHVSQGLYECRAENELGLIRTTAYMTVRSKKSCFF